MEKSYPVETAGRAASANPQQIATLIVDMYRKAEILGADIEYEARYSPGVATSLRERRENIRSTIALLEAVMSERPRYD
jgi:hypothetical protein